MTSFSTFQRSNAGYTIDQTILIVAIIAILVTLIIISVGWQLINRTSGTKLASQFRQIEDANGQFYSTFRVWPHDSYSSGASVAANMMALTGSVAPAAGAVTYRASIPVGQLRNFIPGFRNTGSIQHNYGAGGVIIQGEAADPFGLAGDYLVVQMTGVPFSEVRESERAIDAGSNGVESYTTGRLVATTAASCITAVPSGVTAATADGDNVNVCYAANLVQ